MIHSNLFSSNPLRPGRRASRGALGSLLAALALAAVLAGCDSGDGGGGDGGDGGGGGDTATGGGGTADPGACGPGKYDCNKQSGDGCESTKECVCTPGYETLCDYNGPPGTEGVGACFAGVHGCLPDGLSHGYCWGVVMPVPEVCGNEIDDDCDGLTDSDDPDATADGDPDGDGFTACDGDCCETTDQCVFPADVHPGAMELPGNGIDDDCEPGTPD